MTSHAARTSPVLRGKWILDNLLNSPPAPPPANVPPLDENPASGHKLTTREKVERHRTIPPVPDVMRESMGWGSHWRTSM
jgi:hypothetical protein